MSTTNPDTRCNCESSLCDHESACKRTASGRFHMRYVGRVCETCAKHACTSGGAEYLSLDSSENGPAIHTFESTADAYNASQCSDEISDGDILLVPGESVGVLVQAWPVIVSGHVGSFHTLANGEAWITLDDGKYAHSAFLARDMVPAERVRYALVSGNPESVGAYLPANYRVIARADHGTIKRVVISGTDNAGWSLDDYVIPRLASGLYFAKEIKHAGDIG